MNLLDQIAQAREPLIIVDSAGPQVMPGSADRARALAACPLRFVLDRDAMLQCEQLLADRDSMNRSMAAIRMPAPSFWAEWVEPDGNRIGVLVDADELALCGTIETFWERSGDVPDLAQAVVLFDFRRAAFAYRLRDCAERPSPGGSPPVPHRSALARSLAAQRRGQRPQRNGADRGQRLARGR